MEEKNYFQLTDENFNSIGKMFSTGTTEFQYDGFKFTITEKKVYTGENHSSPDYTVIFEDGTEKVLKIGALKKLVGCNYVNSREGVTIKVATKEHLKAKQLQAAKRIEDVCSIIQKRIIDTCSEAVKEELEGYLNSITIIATADRQKMLQKQFDDARKKAQKSRGANWIKDVYKKRISHAESLVQQRKDEILSLFIAGNTETATKLSATLPVYTDAITANISKLQQKLLTL